MQNTTDLRVKKTQRFLKEALEVMLEDQLLEDIQITELCERAEVNRSTFYRHYHDVFALYQEILTDFFEASLEPVDFALLFNEPARFFESLTESVNMDFQKFRKIHMSNMSYFYNDLFEKILTRHVFETGRLKDDAENKVKLSMIFGTFLRYLPTYPAKDLAAVISESFRRLYLA